MSTNHIIILAAGKGTRMKSSLSKVLHKVGGKTLIEHAMHLAQQIKSDSITLVVPPDHKDIQDVLKTYPGLNYAVQEQQLGTGDALRSGLKKISSGSGTVLVLNSDMPFVTCSSVQQLIKRHKKHDAAVSILTADVREPRGLGRIVRHQDGSVQDIIEEKDATILQKLKSVSS